MKRRVLVSLASLKITVVLLALSLLLVYLGTWAQVDLSAQHAEKVYFHTLVAWVPVSVILDAFTGRGDGFSGTIPLPGGYLLGALLLINLVAAHAVKVRWHWSRFGVWMVHASVLLLLVGELVRSLMAVESRMKIQEGSYADYSYRLDRTELAVTTPSGPEHEDVTVVPASQLSRAGAVVEHPELPFEVRVVRWFSNSALSNSQEPRAQRLANAGPAQNLGVVPLPAASETGAIDSPTAFVQLSRDGRDLGTWLLSVYAKRQPIEVAGKTYEVELRFERDYKPYRLHLVDFSFDRYTGTDVAKNFSSRVRLVDPELNEDREVKIWMNHPLRHRGETFYQADWDRATERGTVLQVVHNPGWMLPYTACVVGGLGLTLHFGISLFGFLRKRAGGTPRTGRRRPVVPDVPQTPEPAGWRRSLAVWFPVGVLALCLLYVGAHLRPPSPTGPFDVHAFGELPISHEGRVQPLDSVARNAMKVLAHKESFRRDGERTPAIQWLVDLLSQNERALDDRIFRIDHPDVQSLLGLDPGREGFVYTVRELMPSSEVFAQQYRAASSVPAQQRTLYQKKILKLGEQIRIHQTLSRTAGLHLVPPGDANADWRPLGEAIDPTTGRLRVSGASFVEILRAHHGGQDVQFNERVHAYRAWLDQRFPGPMGRVDLETSFNRFAPNVVSIALYLLVMVLAASSWLGWTRPLRKSAYWVLALALIIHTGALIARIYISGRPPVTNLANSAIFIGWGAALLAAGIERVYRNGLPTFVAGLVAFPTLLIAHILSFDGDTMKVLQAVLDTNFWLATHVIIITLGYSAMFLAGVLGIVFVVGGFFTKAFNASARTRLSKMIYGVTCFALLFSFIGTVLGGIWADQSWGRFWGWDPKENGAAMIVLMCALLLHARFGGMVKERGIAALAIAGNVVTSWSWFGTNLLGVGLHSYGFMDGAVHWLLLFVFSQLSLIGIAMLPTKFWRSYRFATPGGEESYRGKRFARPSNHVITSSSGDVFVNRPSS
ncbi:MAG: cytochrome c biogenesis protein CcsA [Myxococcota bacterium]